MVSTARSRNARDFRSIDIRETKGTGAWRFRNSKPGVKKFRHSSSSPTSTSSAGSSSGRESRHRRLQRFHPLPEMAHPYGRTGSLRSSRSMPGLAMGTTWDGRPCPVHGSPRLHLSHLPYPPSARRSGSMVELRASPAPSFYSTLPPPPGIYATLPLPPPMELQSHYGSLRSVKSSKTASAYMLAAPSRPPSVIAVPVQHPHPGLPIQHPHPGLPIQHPHPGLPIQHPHPGLPLPPLPPPNQPFYQLPPMPPTYLLPPGARPRPLVIPVGAEPLPIREPAKKPLALTMKEVEEKKGYSCCRGPMPFVWFVVVLVSVGVILGIILAATLG